MTHLKALAKLNLFLHVLHKRDDGYHALDSLIVFTDLYDTITIHENGNGRLNVTGEFASLVPTASNLIQKLRDMLRPHLPAIAQWDISLQKNIPVGAGLGGGSADAAALLKYAYTTHKIDKDIITLCANELGSDILACLDDTHKMLRGRGDILIPHQKLPARPCLILWPRHELSTAQVFQNFSLPKERVPVSLPLSWDDVLHLDNDLADTALALCPAIGDMITALDENGATMARMTGSGSAVFAVFQTDEARDKTAAMIEEKYPHCWMHAGFIN